MVDPFAGGGSIPLEALRLGCDAFASDLNPVAVLINKVMLEDIPRYGKAKIKITKNDGSEVEADGLAEALRIAGAEVKAAAEKELAEFYPLDPDGSRPIAYLWARHGALRGAELRCRDSAGALILAGKEGKPHAGTTLQGQADTRAAAASGV